MIKRFLCVLSCLLVEMPALANITRTARGTTNATNSSAPTLSVTAGTTGSSLIVGVHAANAATLRTVSSISWTGGTFTIDTSTTNIGGSIKSSIEIWKAHNVTAGTNTMTVTLSGSSAAIAIFVTELNSANGAITSASQAKGAGSTNPATTGSATCTPNSSAQCAWIGALGVQSNNTDSAPTWTIPTTAGQKDGTTAEYVAEGYEIDSSGLSQSGSTSMATQRAYGFVIATYQDPSPAASTSVSYSKERKLGILDGE